jgi:folylpolyglutamate synthase/dihydropteroate synthase
MSADKEKQPVLKTIIPLCGQAMITRFQSLGRRCADPRVIGELAKKYLKNGARIKTYLDPRAALDDALNAARKNDVILVTGSFYLAGEMRARWFPENRILDSRKSFFN